MRNDAAPAPSQPSAPCPPSDGDNLVLALWASARDGDAARMRSLLAQGVDPALSFPWGDGHLIEACAGGHLQGAQIALAFCDPHARGAGQATALMAAASAGSAACVRLLLPVSEPDARDINGKTALMRAAVRSHLCVKELLAAGADASLEDLNGWTPLALAVSAAQIDSVAALLPFGDLSNGPRAGQTVMDVARARGSPELADFLESHARVRAERQLLASSIAPPPKPGAKPRL